MRPGMTGLWQSEARDNPSFSAYRRLDLFYVDNWSLSLDVAILANTLHGVGVKALRAFHSSVREGQKRPCCRDRAGSSRTIVKGIPPNERGTNSHQNVSRQAVPEPATAPSPPSATNLPGRGRVLIIVQNLPVPFDRRVWLECQTLTEPAMRSL